MLGQVGHTVHEVREAHVSGMFCTCMSADPTHKHTRTHAYGHLYVPWSVWLVFSCILVKIAIRLLFSATSPWLFLSEASSPALVPLLIINHHCFCAFLSLNVSAHTCTVGGSDKSTCVPPVFQKLHPCGPCDWPFFAFRESRRGETRCSFLH